MSYRYFLGPLKKEKKKEKRKEKRKKERKKGPKHSNTLKTHQKDGPDTFRLTGT